MATELIAHRINTIGELQSLPDGVGVELDLRDYNESLILQHDPFVPGESFESFLGLYKGRGTLILNVKSERIEDRILHLLEKYKVKEYFFLDSSFPMIFNLSSRGEKNIALRLSEFEGMDTIRNFRHKVKWIWVDCFTKFVLTKDIEIELRELGYKICIVSPELQGRKEDIQKHINLIVDQELKIDAVCSKISNHPLWDSLNKI